MSIQAEIGLNTSPFLKGAQEVKAATERMMKDVKSASKGGAEHGFGTMRGERSAERGITKIAQGLFSAHNGSEALAVGLEKVGRIMHLGLGLGVAVHLVANFIEKNQKVIEQFDKMTEAAEKFKEASKAAVESGGWQENIAALKQAHALMQQIAEARKADEGGLSAIRRVVSGDTLFHGKERREVAAKRAEADASFGASENAEAALEDLRLEARIARLRADGHMDEAKSLENERRLRKELVAIESGPLDDAKKKEAKALKMETAQYAEDAAKDAERNKRIADSESQTLAANAKASEEIYETQKKRATLGEDEATKMARLVTETQEYAAALQKAEAGGDHNAALFTRAAMETRITEILALQVAEAKKFTAELERHAEARAEAAPGIMQSAYGLAAGISGDQGIMDEVDRRKRYAEHLERLSGGGDPTDRDRQAAASLTRLEDLKKQRDDLGKERGKPGRADANRRLGFGGFAERGTDPQLDLARKRTELTSDMLAELKTFNANFARTPVTKLDKTAVFAP